MLHVITMFATFCHNPFIKHVEQIEVVNMLTLEMTFSKWHKETCQKTKSGRTMAITTRKANKFCIDFHPKSECCFARNVS